MIHFDGVTFAYRHGWLRPQVRTIFRDLNWHVPEGRMTALVGRSGSGKSTAIRLALGLIAPQAGQVRVGRSGPSAGPSAGRSAIQWVPQHPDAAFDPRMTMAQSLREALAIHRVRGDAARRRVQDVTDQVGLSQRLLDRRPQALSGGEVQRFGLARALMLDPEVLLLDEPTSMLDVSVQAEVMRIVTEVQRARHLTVVLVTHDIALARCVADRIDRIDDGRITTSERPAAKAAAPSTMPALEGCYP